MHTYGRFTFIVHQKLTQHCKAIICQFKPTKQQQKTNCLVWGQKAIPRGQESTFCKGRAMLAGLELAFSKDLGSVIIEFS